jgi:hypothetical protein
LEVYTYTSNTAGFKLLGYNRDGLVKRRERRIRSAIVEIVIGLAIRDRDRIVLRLPGTTMSRILCILLWRRRKERSRVPFPNEKPTTYRARARRYSGAVKDLVIEVYYCYLALLVMLCAGKLQKMLKVWGRMVLRSVWCIGWSSLQFLGC